MIDELYKLGALRALQDYGYIEKDAGAKHLAGGALGAVLGSMAGAAMAPAVADVPKGVMGFPPTQGILEHDLRRNSRLGAGLGALAGAGLGALSPEILRVLGKLRGERVKDILTG